MLSKTGATTLQVGQGLWWTAVAVNADKVEAEGEVKYRMYLFIEEMSRSFVAEASLLCDKCAVLRETMNQPFYFDVHAVHFVLSIIIHTNKCTTIYIYIFFISTPTCFSAPAPSSGSLNFVLSEVTNYTIIKIKQIKVHNLPVHKMQQHSTSRRYMQPPIKFHNLLTFINFIVKQTTAFIECNFNNFNNL